MLTAVVCTRDRPHLLRDCLVSIHDDLPPGGELIVVAHGGPTDAAAVEALGVPARVLHDDRAGKSGQLNVGLLAAAHDLVVLTDDDCRVPAGWLAAMAAPFDDPSVGAAFGDVQGLSGVRGVEHRFVPVGPAPAVTWSYANGAAMALRRQAALDVGGFDERLGPGAPVHGEEHDIVLRLQEAGWEVRIADAPVVEHLEWRDEGETRRNLLVYSKGAGAFLGAAVRRSPRRWARTVVRRSRYQLSLWRHRSEGWTFGPATTWAFARGFVHGLLLRPWGPEQLPRQSPGGPGRGP